jgi:hypothetical protein
MLEETERNQIVRALEDANGVVVGPNGAAARLGLKRSTLQLRMQKLGIRPSRTTGRHLSISRLWSKWRDPHWKSVNTSAFELSRWRVRRCACDTPDIVGYQNVLNRLSPFSNKPLACNALQAKVDSIPIA